MSKFCCTALLSIAFIAPSVAQTPQDTLPDNELNQVVVTAQFVPTDIRQTVNVVRVLDRKTIERRAAINLEELLQTETGVRLTQDAVLGSAVSINGLNGENVKILVDGVPVVGRMNGSVDAGQLPLGAVQQIEIIEGAQSLIYGSAASAGVINLVSRKNQAHRFEIESNTQIEGNGYQNFQGRVGVKFGKFQLQLTGNQLDFKPTPDTSQGRDQIWNPKTQTNGRALLRFSPSERLDIRLSGGMFSEQVDNLGNLRRPNYKPYAFDDFYKTRRKDANLISEGRLKRSWFWQTTMGWSRFDRVKNSYRFDFDDEKLTLLDEQQDTSAFTGLLARATLASDRANRRLDYLFGVENYRETAEGARIVDSTSNRYGRADVSDFALFSSVKAHFLNRKLTLQGGARWTQNQLYGSAVTPSVWMLWRPINRLEARVSYASGFRSPSLKELYLNFIDINHYVVGNSALRPEYSDNLHAELKWKSDISRPFQWSATASGFYNDIRNRIILSEFGPVQYRYVNLEKWTTTGGGLALRAAWNEWLQFNSTFNYTGFYNHLASRADSLPVLNWSPDWMNEIRLSGWNQHVGLSVWHKMTGRTPYFIEDEKMQITQGAVEAWDMLNVSANFSLLNNRIRLNTGVKNVFNKKQIRAGATDGEGHIAANNLQSVHWGRLWFLNAVVTLGW